MNPVSTPYWLHDVVMPATSPHAELPNDADAVVIGGGLTGLSAARELARQGLSVVLLERDGLLSHASGRNGGHVNNGTAGNFGALVASRGLEHAVRLYRFFDDAVDTVERITTEANIACDFVRCGKLKVAWTPAQFASLRADQETLSCHVDTRTSVLDRHAVTREMGTDRFVGGLLYEKSAQMHVGRFGAGLARAAIGAGVQVFENLAMTGLARVNGLTHVRTAQGTIRTPAVLLATGISRNAPSWFRRRIMPVGSFIIATDPLDEDLFAQIVPGRRNVVTTRNIHNYFRTTPDRRVIFGGRANFRNSSERADAKSAVVLHKALVEIYPQLNRTRVACCWGGDVDMSVDRLPHAGEWKGITYAMGLSGHGVQMSVHLGTLLGQKLAGQTVDIPAWNAPWAPIPAYGLARRAMPIVGAYYGMRDRFS